MTPLKQINVIVISLCLSLVAGISQASDSASLSNAISGEHRSELNKQRDTYRHPLQTIEFMGVKANMSVIEVWPGTGWYTEVLAPYIKQGGGQFIAAGFPQQAGPKWRQIMQREYQQWLAEFPTVYDQVKVVELGPPDYWVLGADNSVDAVLTFRNVHNWLKGGYEVDMLTAFYNVLKPGGILGVTDHRALPGTDLATMKKSGYLTQKRVIALAEEVGFVLEATSEINANSLDTKDHPKGVWTLPPTLRLGDKNKSHYLAIGESDRMTLRFTKPQ